MRCLAAILLSCFLSTSADAGMCEEDNTLLEREFVWDFQNGFAESLSLPLGNLNPSPIQLHLGTDGSPFLYGKYESHNGEVGIPYYLYRLEIQIGEGEDTQLIDQDYTSGCEGIPAGLGPGHTLTLVPIKLQPHANGSPLAVERVRVRFWGR